MRPVSPVATAALTAVLGLTLTACGPSAQTGSGDTNSANPDPSHTTTPAQTRPIETPDQEDQMELAITVGDQRFRATLRGSQASRDLLAQLPLTVQMRDHGSVEKTGPLPRPLSLQGQPAGADPDIGDVGYYAPGNDLVLYYGDQSYYDGIVVLGRLDADAAARIADMVGAITATITVATT